MFSFRSVPGNAFGSLTAPSSATNAAASEAKPTDAKQIEETPVATFFAEHVIPAYEGLSKTDKRIILTRIAGYSILDFLALSNSLQLSTRENAQILSHPDVQRKNGAFFKELGAHAERVANHATGSDEKKHLNALQRPKKHQQTTADFYNPSSDAVTNKLAHRIDGFYAKYIAQRSVVSPAPREKLSFNDELVERLIKKHACQFGLYGREIPPELEGGLNVFNDIYREHGIKHLKAEILRSLSKRGIDPDTVDFAQDEAGRFAVNIGAQRTEVFPLGIDCKNLKEIYLVGRIANKPVVQLGPKADRVILLHGDKLSEEFHTIGEVKEVAGKLAFKARLANGKWVVVYDGKRSEEFRDVNRLEEIGGKLAFTAELADESGVVIQDGERFGPFRYVDSLTEVAGGLAFAARLADGKWVAVHNGERSEPFWDVNSLKEVAGGLAFKAELEDGTWVVVHNGKRSQAFCEEPYFEEVAGGLAVMGHVKNKGWVVEHNGKRSGPFKAVNSLTEVAGGLAFKAQLEDQTWVVVHNGKHSQAFRSISQLTEITGGLAYTGQLENEKWVVVNNGTLSEEYDWMPVICNVAGQVAYCVPLADGSHSVIHGSSRFRTKDQVFIDPLKAGPLLYTDTKPQLYVDGKLAHDHMLHHHHVADGDTRAHLLLRDEQRNYYVQSLPLSQSTALTPRESALVQKLTLVASPTVSDVAAYLAASKEEQRRKRLSPEERVMELRSGLRAVISNVNGLIKESPELFADLFRAKTTKPLPAYCEAVVRAVAPGALSAYRRAQNKQPPPSNCSLSGSSKETETDLVSGDPRNDSGRIVLSSTLTGPTFVCKALVAEFSGNRWKKFHEPSRVVK